MFDEAAVNTFVDNVVSHAATLNMFRNVASHEPKRPPGPGLLYAVWADIIEPLVGSGLSSLSGYVVVSGRIYGNMLQRPEDEIDPRILKACTTLLGAYAGDFNFGATARAVDFLGQYGNKLRGQAGYVMLGDGMYRVMTITIPVIFNDMWDLVA